MDCDDVKRLLQSGRALPPEAVRHVEGCAGCAAMIGVAPRLGTTDDADGQGDDALLAATLAVIEDDRGARSWLRERSVAVRLALALAIAVLVPLVVVLVRPRADLGGYPRARMLAELAVLAGVWALAAAVTLRPMQRALPSWLRIAASTIVLVAIAVLASLPPAHEHVPVGFGGMFVRQAAACLVFGTLAALPAWITLRIVARDGGALGRRAAVLAAAAAAVGVAAVFLHCAIVDPRHLWAGHATIAAPLLLWAWLHGRARDA